ncbi:MAG: putative DNA-binding WGR domain protein [Polyangiales bacterium]|jgi:predicted DNA-binding WGR domain protein
MTRVYLEYCGETWTKFWSARTEGNDVITVYGKRGGKTRETRTDLESPEAALAAIESEATRKRRKGYVDSCSEGAEQWDELRALQTLSESFSSVPGPRTCVQLLHTETGMPILGKSRVGGAAPRGIIAPQSDSFLRFLGKSAESTDTRQAHVMTIAMEELAVKGMPIGSALSFFTPVYEWLPATQPIEVVVADMNSDLTPLELELPPIPPGYARHRAPRGLRISRPVEVPTLAFSMHAYDYDEYALAYEDESRALNAAPASERSAILSSGKFAEVFYWTGKRKKLSQTQFEAIDRIQLLLTASGYVGGSALRRQGPLEPEFSKFHCQFGESFGVHVRGGTLYAGLQESSWDSPD